MNKECCLHQRKCTSQNALPPAAAPWTLHAESLRPQMWKNNFRTFSKGGRGALPQCGKPLQAADRCCVLHI